MFFSDIHMHLLCGTDDGAKNTDIMFGMVDKAYADGTRLICATPHFCPSDFGDNRVSADKAFEQLKNYCADKYPDLKLFLGNELYCENDGIQWLKKGYCRTMNGSRYVLAEFPVEQSEENIVKAIYNLMGLGYVPIIAHAERYFKLSLGFIKELRLNGVLVQVNTRKNFSGCDFREKRRLKSMFSRKLVDFVSSDAHDLVHRPPCMSDFFKLISEKYGVEYAEAVFRTNAERIFSQSIET